MQPITIDPDPYKPFHLSQGQKAGNLLFISGQAGINERGEIVGQGDFEVQAHQAFANLEKVLRAGGSDLSRVVKVTIFLRDMANFEKVVALRKQYFHEPYPADSIIEVSSLYAPQALIEIEP